MLKIIEQAEGIDVFNIFKESGAIFEGHFKLTSGLHSGVYMQCAKLLQYPDRADMLAKAAAGILSKDIDMGKVDTVISPAVGGILWGYMLAFRIEKKMIFTERADGEMQLRRGFDLREGEKVIVAEDVITTGGSVKEVIKICEDSGAEVAGVISIVDRNSGIDFGYPYYNMLKIDIEIFEPGKCPMCREGQEIVYPGSRK
ncbi:MAG: orotate phosphoribosyltransferase [Actinobacteria bacterium]|jgi:orotate phosphoribosyltransferase|nr:orotate phosphoribosyltransferase [Actinomycetota bacterium]